MIAINIKKSLYTFFILLVAVSLFSSSPAYAAGTWTEQTGSGSRSWTDITSSSDGAKLAAVINGGSIYTSTDSGVTWTQQTDAGTRLWTSITSSSDGSKLAATVSRVDDNGIPTTAGYIYTSTDSGVTWTEQTGSGSHMWRHITSSSDGSKLAATEFGSDSGSGDPVYGYIYTSTDSGVTWTEQTNSNQRRWTGITSSSDGSKLAASVFSNYIYTSTDSGATWTQQTESGARAWSEVVSSADGSKLAAADSSGYIYTSTDSGATWTAQTGSGLRSWAAITSSSDGSKLAASASSNYIYTSTDSGATWTQQTDAGSRSWSSITSSSDGSKLAAIVSSGYIYTYAESSAAVNLGSLGGGSRSYITASCTVSEKEVPLNTAVTFDVSVKGSEKTYTFEWTKVLSGTDETEEFEFTESGTYFPRGVVKDGKGNVDVVNCGSVTVTDKNTDSAEENVQQDEEGAEKEVKTNTLSFSKDLKFGDEDAEIIRLQHLLNSIGFTVAASGPGSLSEETSYFGTLTQQALQQFQRALNIVPADGVFSGITRDILNLVAMLRT